MLVERGIGPSRSRVMLALFLSAALTLAAGCGKAAEKAGEKVGEKIGETIVSTVTGGAVQVDADKESVTFTDEDGQSVEFTVSAGGVPEGYPLPVPAGWQADEFIVTEESDGSVGWVGLFYFEGDAKDVSRDYQRQLESMGLEVSSMEMEEGDDYSNLLGVAGVIDGTYYAGILGFTREEGRNVVSVVFGEGEDQ